MEMTYVDGAKEFDIPVKKIYEFNRQKNRAKKAEKKPVAETENKVVIETESDSTAAETENKVVIETESESTSAEIENKVVVEAETESTAAETENTSVTGAETITVKESKPAFEQSTLPMEIQQLIIDHRKKHPDHGFKRISDQLKGDHLVVVRRKQIRKVLKAHGLLETNDSSFDQEEPAKGTRRFEASYAGELYQMDVSYVYLTGIPVLYLVAVIDDYSRYCVGAELCHDHRGDTVIGVFHNACIRHGKPRKLLTDQGTEFYSWSEKQTLFQEYLDENKIEHIVCDPHSPQTQGKIERLFQTIKRECFGRIRFNGYGDALQGLADYIRNYNYGRPHQGIAGFRPADRFHGIIGERSRIEAELAGKELDFSKGYCIFKVQDHCVSVVSSGEGIQVMLDGKLLQEANP